MQKRLLLNRQLSCAEACQLHIAKLRAAGYNPAHFPYFDWSQ